jgi:hypothetical protein
MYFESQEARDENNNGSRRKRLNYPRQVTIRITSRKRRRGLLNSRGILLFLSEKMLPITLREPMLPHD